MDNEKRDVIVSGPVYWEAATIQAHLRKRLGDRYSTEWLSGWLGLAFEDARALEDYWLPHVNSYQFLQAMRIFGNSLGFSSVCLAELISRPPYDNESAARTLSVPSARRVADRAVTGEKTAKTTLIQPSQVEIRVGSSDGVRILRQRQPVITYRKDRRKVPV